MRERVEIERRGDHRGVRAGSQPAPEDLVRRFVPELVLGMPGHEITDLGGRSRRQCPRCLGRPRPAQEVVQTRVPVPELLHLVGDILQPDPADEHVRGEVVAERADEQSDVEDAQIVLLHEVPDPGLVNPLRRSPMQAFFQVKCAVLIHLQGSVEQEDLAHAGGVEFVVLIVGEYSFPAVDVEGQSAEAHSGQSVEFQFAHHRAPNSLVSILSACPGRVRPAGCGHPRFVGAIMPARPHDPPAVAAAPPAPRRG